MLIILCRQVAAMLSRAAQKVTYCAALGLFFSTMCAYAAMPIRNVTPFAQGIGLPEIKDGRLLSAGESQLTSQLLWTSLFYEGINAGEKMLIDGEALQLDLFYRHRFEKFELQINVPFVRYSGGTMDNVIDFWHDTFNLPNGGRGRYRADQINFFYETGGARYEMTSSYEGVADVRLSVGFNLYQSSESAHAIYLYSKLPTADNIWLSSGGVDAGLALSHQFSAGLLQYQLQYAVTFVGNGDWLEDERTSIVYSVNTALGYVLTNSLSAELQFAGNSDLFKNDDERILSAGLLLSIGFNYDINGDKLSVALVEDIIADTAPDVSFLFSYQAGF